MAGFSKRRLVVTGANGMLGKAVQRKMCEKYELITLGHEALDIADREEVAKALKEASPKIILNCAAYTNVDGCEVNETVANKVNGEGPGNLAAVAKSLNAILVHVSTDYVFDGEKGSPYIEEDVPRPRSVYGRSKLKGEQRILESGLEKYFILRTSWLYGHGGKNFVETIIRLAKEREELRIVADQIGTPTYTWDLAQAIFNLVSPLTPDSSSLASYGVYHFSNEGQCSWYEFASEIITQLKMRGEELKVQRVLPIKTEEYPLPAARPAYSVLSKGKYQKATGAVIPEWRESLSCYMNNRQF